MFKIDDIVVHKRDICRIIDIKENFRFDEDYYTLIPLEDSSLVIHTPTSNKRGMLRNVISKIDAEAIILKIPEIKVVVFEDDRILESTYTTLIDSGKHEDLIKIIKTTYLRKEERINSGQKICEKDKKYFNLAEKMFYTELSIALDKTYQETKEYIENTVAELVK